MSFLNSPFYWRSAYSLCFLLSRVALCSGGLPVPLTMEEEPVTARARLQLPLERRDSISTCQGTTGYYACAASLGGGCCPEGLVCATDGLCSWNAAATTTSTGLVCDTEYYQCPISLGGEYQRHEIEILHRFAEAPKCLLTVAQGGVAPLANPAGPTFAIITTCPRLQLCYLQLTPSFPPL